MKCRLPELLLISLSVTFSDAASGQDGDHPELLFQDNGVIDVRITAPLTTLVRERPTDDYLTGTLEYAEDDGTAVQLDVEIRTRGHFRRENCDFPPIRLNFRKSQTEGTLFGNQDKLKLVVHCDKSAGYEQIVLREFLAYRILNSVSDLSFRVRLLRVTYIDNEKRRDDRTRFAFLIEHKNRLAKRLQLQSMAIERTAVAAIRADQLNLTSIFEYLIGNSDFSPIAGAPDRGCCHNYVLFGKDTDLLTAIPYDFDQSGFVDAPYARPSASLRISTVRKRVYRGRCVNNEHVPTSLQRFRDERDAIDELIAAQQELTRVTRSSISRYVDRFYSLIDNPKDVEKQIIKKCL